MRIAYVVSLFPKLSETFILREILGLRARGHDVRILSLKRETETIRHPEADGLMEATDYPGGIVSLIGATLWWIGRRPWALAQVAARIAADHAAHPVLLAKSLALIPLSLWAARRLLRLGATRVHAHWASWPAQTAWISWRLTGIPYSVTAHAHDLFLPNPMLPRKVSDSRFFATISEYNRSFLIQACGAGALGRIRLIRCGLPLDQLPFAPPRPAAESGGPASILSVGRLVDYKGFDVLIRAMAILKTRGLRARCLIVGEGPERGRLARLIGELDLSGEVALTGGLLQKGVMEAMRAADLFALACRTAPDGQQDGIPIVLMEAMALGLPVVSTPISGIPELLIDSATGLLAAPEDPEHLAQVIGRLLGDRKLAALLARAARDKIEAEYSLDRSLDALCEAFSGPQGAGR